jgi:hypothetical protein
MAISAPASDCPLTRAALASDVRLGRVGQPDEIARCSSPPVQHLLCGQIVNLRTIERYFHDQPYARGERYDLRCRAFGHRATICERQ